MDLHSWILIFGLLGNVISFMVSLAPMPTFYVICKKKTSEGFQSLPYVIALFSAMLWLFYALYQKGVFLLITINSFTFFMEIGYIAIYLFYANKKDKILTVKLVLLFNVFGFGIVALLGFFVMKGQTRIKFLGWVCMVFALCVFAAPLAILRKVIKTRSVEYMPFSLSLFLTLNAVMWFFYGFLKKDYYVAIPNILGFIFGIIQMGLYVFYKNKRAPAELPVNKEHELNDVDHSAMTVVPQLVDEKQTSQDAEFSSKV